ncbi:MAG: hypothetical protein ACK5CE_22375 [Actinomycetes bacterium]
MTESNVGVVKSALPVDESIDVEASPERVWEKLPDGGSLAAAHREGWRPHLGNWARAASHAPSTVLGELGC